MPNVLMWGVLKKKKYISIHALQRHWSYFCKQVFISNAPMQIFCTLMRFIIHIHTHMTHNFDPAKCPNDCEEPNMRNND